MSFFCMSAEFRNHDVTRPRSRVKKTNDSASAFRRPRFESRKSMQNRKREEGTGGGNVQRRAHD